MPKKPNKDGAKEEQEQADVSEALFDTTHASARATTVKNPEDDAAHVPSVERMGRWPKPTSPMTAIRAKCGDCTCWQIVEVRECPAIDCPLWKYRMGHRPPTGKVAKARTPAQLAATEKLHARKGGG